MYEFEYKDMEFSKDGSLDELIVLDRYAVPTYDDYRVGDTIVAIVDKKKDSKAVGEIVDINDDHSIVFTDRHGDSHTVERDLIHKPLETKPHQLWSRWAKGAASIEKDEDKRLYWEDEFRWLNDGYRYSLGGRIQLMLGQEFITGKKANLTAYNCYVSESPKPSADSLTQFINVINTAEKQANIHRVGGGDGINISTIQTVKGSGMKKNNFIFYLSKNHPDYQELVDEMKLGKFKHVTIITDLVEFNKIVKSNNTKLINAIDSIKDGLFNNIREQVIGSYGGFTIAIDFSGLRERRAIVRGVNGRSSGAESWMELFSLVAETLQMDTIDCVDFAEIFSFIVNLIQQGGSRRGALMLILNVSNAAIRKFITRKKKSGHLNGANVSVGIDDVFMERVRFAKGAEKKDVFADINEYTKAKESLEIWNLLVQSAWESAEPGVVWLERYNKESNSWYFSDIICTNPCGLQYFPI